MRILTEIGEIGVHAPNRDVLLRPSLYAMGRLSDPVGLLVTLHEGTPRDQFDAALDVLQVCTDEDISDITGHVGSRYGTWVCGSVPTRDLITLARSLIRHGVLGVVPKLPPLPDDGNAFTPKFEAREFVAVAIAHLGLSEREAWDLTVTSFILAMRAKFPRPKNGPGAPSATELDTAFERLNAINKVRR
jgi:hypothetical protein